MSENILKHTGPGVLCKVCGDRASGKHYGVPSCDGCRGFFKRSIRRNLEYICKEGEKCIVDVSRRNQCQACRFSKCLQANMRREAVQHERAPRSCMTTQQMPINGITMEMYSTPRRLPSLTPSGLFLPMPMHIPTIDTSRYFPSFQGGMLDPLQLGNGVFMPPKINTNYLNTSLRSSPGNNSSGKDDEVTSSEETQNTNFTNLRTNFKKEAIFESAAKLLFLAVKWARSVPSFSQLPVRDQTILLEESWAELFVITSAQWGLTLDNEFLSNEPGWKNLQRAINKFVGMRIDQTEAACLKALTLFKPDSLGLLSCHQIASLQDQTLSLLSEKCGGVRLGHILLILPVVKTAANPQLLQEMLFKTTVGEVAIERLLGDLMKT